VEPLFGSRHLYGCLFLEPLYGLSRAEYYCSKMAGQVEQMSKAKFLELYSQVYGYGGTIHDLRNKEFCRVKDTYLDHIGATLYAESQIDSYCNELKSFIFGNPHSQNASSQRSSEMIEEIRRWNPAIP